MNHLIRTVLIMLGVAFAAQSVAHAQTPVATGPSAAALQQVDSTRSVPPIRIPGRATSSDTSGRTGAIVDTLHRAHGDSLRAAIPTHPDSLLHLVPLRSVGSLAPIADRLMVVDAEAVMWKDYRTLTDLLTPTPGLYVADKGSPGQDNTVSFTGAGQAATSFLVDGIEQNDPFTHTYDFALMPVEAVDRIEIVPAPRSFLYGDDAAGGAVNVVTKSFSNNKPYTRIRYSQAPNTYVQTDALFSQNVISRLNLMLGLSYLGYGIDNQSNYYQGRFNNAAHGGYTFRAKLRYNVSPTLNLFFEDFYDKTQTDLNGGIDIRRTDPVDWFNEAVATVINTDAYEKRSNHRAMLGGAYRPDFDTSLTASVTLFGAYTLREYRDEENRAFSNGILIHDNFGSLVLGAHAQVDWTWGGNAFSASAEAKRTEFDRSVYAPSSTEARSHVSVKDELSPFRFMTLAGYVKVEDGQKQLLENFGADATLRISDVLSMTAGASQAHRHPSPAERYLASGAADTLIAKTLKFSDLTPWTSPHAPLIDEIHHVSEASLYFKPQEAWSASLTATRRMIDSWIDNSLIAPHQAQNVTFDVLTAALQMHAGRIYVDGSIEYTHQSTVIRGDAAAGTAYPVLLYPRWHGGASVYYKGSLVKGNLELKAGMNGRFFSAYEGMQDRFADGVSNPTLNQTVGNAGVLDLFVIAHLGDAQIHIIFENVTNTDYMLAPFYPMYDRGLRFGLSWEFWN